MIVQNYKKFFLFLSSFSIVLIVGFFAVKYAIIYRYNLKIQSLRAESAKIPAEKWDEKYKNADITGKKYKVVYVTCNGGEYSAAEYFKYAAHKLGWEVKIFYHSLLGREEEFLNFDPDIVIISWFISSLNAAVDDRIIAHRSKKYVWVSLPLEIAYKNRYISKKKFLKVQNGFKTWLSYAHGMLITPEDEVSIYKEIWENQLKKEFNGIKMLPLTPGNDYAPAEPKKLTWASLGWDKFRSSSDYKQFITSLSENVPMRVYGPYNIFSYLKDGIYGGYIPPGLQNIEALRKNGIYLLTHSHFHNNGNVPSMRPFEAAAANVITISDKNPFVMKHFGDSMLYFDQNVSSGEMYKQVKMHMDWIMANPELAKAKADKAHKIFLEKFTVESDFLRLTKMHEYILAKEKEMNLDYSLSYVAYQ